MKKIYSFLLIGVLAITTVMAEDTVCVLEKIQKTGVFTVAICKNDTFPMYYIDKEKGLAGYDIELATLIAEELNAKLRFDRTAETLEDVVDLVATGKVDAGISMLSMTPRRALKVRFTDPYLCIHPVLVENLFSADRSSYKGDTSEIRYASEAKGTVYVDIVKKMYPGISVYEEKSWDVAMMNTVKNISQIMIRDEIGVYTAINKNKELLLNIKITPLLDQFDYISVAVDKNQEVFVEWLNVFFKVYGYPKTAKDLL